MTQDVTRPVWNKVGKRKIGPMLIGSQLHSTWRMHTAEITQFRFTGPLQAALRELSDAARKKKLYLPVTSLRTTLALTVEDLVGVDQDLGMGRLPLAAIETYRSDDAQAVVLDGLSNWVSQQLLAWSVRHDLERPAIEVTKYLSPDNLLIQHALRPYANEVGQPDFPIIARDLAERLIGEELFEKLGPCRFVATGEGRSNTIELTTGPRFAGDGWYSMVATLSVVTVPYAPDPLLKVSALKRNWTQRAPKTKSSGPARFRAYVFSPQGPCVPAWVDRKGQDWVFSDDYAFPSMQSRSALPPTIEGAVKLAPEEGKWWVGLPELPTLFRRIAPRTVFESDERALLDRVRELVAGLAGEEIAFERHNLGRRGQASKFSMLKMEDITENLFIQGLAVEDDDDAFDEGESEELGLTSGKLPDFRKQNEQVLQRLHGEARPHLWVFGGTEREQEIIRNTVLALFGERIECIQEVLPPGTHGLAKDLEPPGEKRRPTVRFQARVEAWRAAVGKPNSRFMTLHAPKYALIVAPDEVERKPEDSVNYHAGIHALSALGANVHHCLPTDEGEGGEPRFLQRVQSSLLDVLFAHSGLVLGVDPFLKQLLEHRAPRYVHGVQVVRSLSRAFTGEQDVRFIAFTRLEAETGRTELQIAYPGSTAPTPWRPLAEALRWLASQTTMAGRNGETWLQQNFNQLIKSWLVSISEVDPQALVLIDWTTLSGRWKGIRDQDLRPGSPPTIDQLNLTSAFPTMSFVRIRRGLDTLSLRSIAEQSYEGWLEGEERKRTGEVLVDSYLTTTKCLAELPHRGQGRGVHFIASMGYQQATQPRGLSCYRSVTRVVATKDDASKRTGRFEPVVRTPASGDQAIPASLDITVLSCPKDVEPAAVAKAVMGLRLGYAHYGEWTSMPAPLFFRRKVEDYIIRYVVDGQGGVTEPGPVPKVSEPTVALYKNMPAPDPEEPAVEREEVVAGLEAEPQRATQPVGVVSKKFEAQVLRPQDPPAVAIMASPAEGRTIRITPRHFDPETAERPVTHCALDTLRKTTAPVTPALATLQKLDEITLPALYHRHSRLYWMLLRGDVKVQVDLPSFATETALFGRHQYYPNKRDLERWWQTLQKHSLVKPREPMVDGKHFWNWHFKKLRTPQSTWFLNSILPLAFNHLAEPIQTIKRRYQTHMRDIGERMPPDQQLMERVLEWVVQNGSDEDLAWLIFDLAHRPTLVSNENLMGYVRQMSGPLTQEAIGYMARVASALLEAIDLVERKVPRINITRPNPSNAAAYVASEGPSTYIHEPGPCARDAGKDLVLEKIMRLKADLISQIEALEPGSTEFDVGLQKAGETLQKLRQLHEQHLELADKARQDAQRVADEAAQEVARLSSLNTRALQMAIDIAGHPLCHDVPEMHLETLVHEPLAVFDPAAPDALNKTAAAMADAEIAYTAYVGAAPRAAAPRQSSTERRAAMLAQASALEQLERAATDLRESVLAAGPIFRLTGILVPAAEVPPEEPVTQAAAAEISAPIGEPEVGEETVVAAPELVKPTPVLHPVVEQVLFPEVPATPLEVHAEYEPEPAAESLAAEGDPSQSLGSEEDAQEALEVLRLLCTQRRYELATLQVDAIVQSQLVADLAPHEGIMRSLFGTLNALDCRFTVNPSVNPSLIRAIENDALSNKLSAPEATAAGVLAASLPYLLFGDLQSADRSTILGFVQPRLQEIVPLTALVQSLWDQTHKNISPTREKLAMTGLDSKAAVEREVRRFRERAANWLHDPMITSTFWNKGTKAINQEIYRPSSPIGALLAAIARGDDKQAEKLHEEARRRLDKPALALTEGMRTSKERTAPDGMYRQRMIENVEVTARFVQDYFGLLAVASGGGIALSKTEKAWIGSVYQQLREGSAAIVHHDGKSLVEKIYYGAARTTLEAALRLFSDETPLLCVEELDQRLLLKLPLGVDFMPSYKGPEALCGPAEVLAETKRLSEESLDLSVSDNDESSLYSALQDAASDHLSNNRFRPAFALRDKINDLKFSNELVARHRKVRVDLRTELDQASKRVVHALSLNSINQAEANRMQRDLSEIDKVLRAEPPVGDPNCEYMAFPDVPHVLAALRLSVTSPLDLRLADTRLKLERQLVQYEDEHPQHAGDIHRIKAMLERDSATDIRAAYDALSSLRNHGQALPSQDRSREYVGARYERFISEVTKGGGRLFLDTLQDLLQQEPSETSPSQLKELDADGREDALRILSIWVELTKNQPRAAADYEKLLEQFFKLVGARIAPQTTYSSVPDKRRVEFHWSEPPFVMPSAGLPPELGSLGLNIRGFLIRGGDSEVEVQQAVTQSSGPTMVLARGRFGMEKRTKLCNRHPVLLADDYLVGWIAVNASGRLAAMLEIALLTFTASPYADFGGQPVPPEMFYGREAELSQLRSVQQAAVLYGGRRLGKSSLLDQIQRDYARGTNQAKAVYLSVDAPEMTDGDHVTWAWRELLKKLVANQVVPPITMPKAQAKDIAAHIEQHLQSADSPIRDLFLLIDEADQLMECELGLATNAPGFVRMLQKLCESLVGSKIRVRYVLAGLHNVARMTTEVNSPLGKATSIALEPFSKPQDIRNGMELITQPLEALGFRFDHDDLPWRIMSVCNFYPAFIQLYCKNLLECLYNKRQNSKPLTIITAQDLDNVEKDDKLLGTLQEKFALNLNLDKRYKAIALILADRYYSGDDSQQGLTAVEAREFCELVAAPHFTTTGPGAYEALLDEMKKLNMLERVGSRYVLRNPNIAMMMGDKAKVIHDIDELSREKVVRSRSTGERRVLIQRANQTILFPMPAAWVRSKLDNTDTDTQLLILVGNKQSGLNEVAMDRGEEWSLCGDDYYYSHQPFRGPQEIDKYVRKLPDSRKERLLAVSASSWKVSQLDELAAVAQKAAKRKIRIALITTPLKVREMLPKLPELLKDPRWSIEAVPSWTEDAVFYHTRENVEISDSASLLQTILATTAGFGLLVDRLTRGRSARKLPEACQAMERTLTTNLAYFHQEVGLTAIEDPPTLFQIAEFAKMMHGTARAATEDLQVCLDTTEAPAYAPALLQWMGLLLRGNDGTWEVPALYLQALEGKT